MRLNEPAILTAKKNRKDESAAPTLVVVQPSTAASHDFQPSKTPDLNFTNNNNNNEGEPVVFSAKPAPVEPEPEAKPTRTTRSRKAASASNPEAAPPKSRQPTKRGRKKKKDAADDEPKDEHQRDIRDAFQPVSGDSAPQPAEIIGEEATAHENDHELVVTPPSSPSKLKEIQQGRKRPKKVAYIVRVTEEEAGECGEGAGEKEADEEEDGGTPRKMKKTEGGEEDSGNVTPKRTPHQRLSPSQMLTPSPRISG